MIYLRIFTCGWHARVPLLAKSDWPINREQIDGGGGCIVTEHSPPAVAGVVRSGRTTTTNRARHTLPRRRPSAPFVFVGKTFIEVLTSRRLDVMGLARRRSGSISKTTASLSLYITPAIVSRTSKSIFRVYLYIFHFFFSFCFFLIRRRVVFQHLNRENPSTVNRQGRN